MPAQILRVVVTALLVTAAVLDFRKRQVPPWISIPLLVAAGISALARGNLPALLAMALALWDIRSPVLETVAAGAAIGLSVFLRSPAFATATLVTLAVYRMWRAGWIGGGDGKLLIGVIGLYPTPEAAVALAAGWLLWGIIWMLIRYRRAFISAFVLALGGNLRPAGTLDDSGVPGAAGVALGWMIFCGWSWI